MDNKVKGEGVTDAPIDLYDPMVMDSKIIETDDVMAILGISTKDALTDAVSRGAIPAPMDFFGKRGKARWTVGMFRQWNLFLAEQGLEKQKREWILRSRIKQVARKPAPPACDALAEAKKLGINRI